MGHRATFPFFRNFNQGDFQNRHDLDEGISIFALSLGSFQCHWFFGLAIFIFCFRLGSFLIER